MGESSRRWSVIVPVRGEGASKTRLDTPLRAALAAAFARDTVAAALRSRRVAEVVVVTAGAFPTRPARQLRIVRDTGAGLHAAIRVGIRATQGAARHRAILLGDLPALRPLDLDDALEAAEHVPRGFVADAEGTGTTLTTARAGTAHVIRFGAGSAALHRSAGYRNLSIRTGSTLRHDVDRLDDLLTARLLRVGQETAATLARLRTG